MCLDFWSSLNINQLHFITCSAVLHRFYHSFFYHSKIFSVHFVARFITERHFAAMYACSEPHVPRTFIAMALRLTRGPAHMQLMRNHAMLATFLKKTGQLWNTNALLFL